MIDSDLVDAMPRDEARMVKQAFATIYNSGILDSQLERLLAQLSAGIAEESDEEMARRIRAFRQQTSQVNLLKELGERFNEELE